MAVTTGRPGVFVSESLIPLAQTPLTPGQAVAAFVGTHSAGPVGPTQISSWSDWNTLFGGFGDGSSMIPFSVYEYFANGGAQCYVVRAVAPDAVAAQVILNDVQTTPAPVLTLTAKAPGTCGNALFVTINPSALDDGRFNLLIRNGSTTSAPVEQYIDVSLDPADARNLIALMGSASGSGSRFLSAEYTGPTTWTSQNTPAAQSDTPLAGGLEGTASPNLVDAAKLLDDVPQLLMVNLPGVSDPLVINPVIAWASGSGDRFLVIDGPQASPLYADTVAAYTDLSPLGVSGATPFTSSSYAALYGPWMHFRDPSAVAPGATRMLPPGGAMLGLYARADATQGTQQAAAGVGYPLAGALSPEVKFAASDLDTMNELGVNIIRAIPGSPGVIPMGARTLAGGMPDRYIPVRRTLMYLTRLCVESTNFAVFRPNNEDLWAQLSSILTERLSALQQDGVLRGATASEAFFVRCDATNNTDNSVANGIVNIEVGVALNSPAEYIVIQIGQIASGATTNDSLAS